MNYLVTYLLQSSLARPDEKKFLSDLQLLFHNSLTLSPNQGNFAFQLRDGLEQLRLSQNEIEEIVEVLFDYITRYKIPHSDSAASIIGTTYCYTTRHLERLIELMKSDEKIEARIKYNIIFLEYLDQSYIEQHIDYVKQLRTKYPDDRNLQEIIQGVMYKYETGKFLE